MIAQSFGLDRSFLGHFGSFVERAARLACVSAAGRDGSAAHLDEVLGGKGLACLSTEANKSPPKQLVGNGQLVSTRSKEKVDPVEGNSQILLTSPGLSVSTIEGRHGNQRFS